MVFLVGFCFFRMKNLALTIVRTQMYWERRSTARVHQCCCINAVTFVFKTQFLAHFPFSAKFITGRIWYRLLAIIRYIGKIWDGREKVIKTEMITLEILTECKLLLLERSIISLFFSTQVCLRNIVYMKVDHHSYRRNFCSCKKKAWKNFELVWDSKVASVTAMISAIINMHIILHPTVHIYDFHI